ncbi:MAG: transposase [Acidobacteriota bacterium]|nr:transposase [Acidobacteriota bacterium]
MPRRARRLQFGEYYHVINRGSVRARIFHTDDDYQIFVQLLAAAVDRFELALLSYCVMPNHWHLIVKPRDQVHLSKSLHWLTVTHAVGWCRTHKRSGPGPVYQGRFKSIPVEPGFHLLRACRYVERNGLRADLAPRAEDWSWSSAAQRAQNRDIPLLQPLQYVTPTDWLVMLNEPVPDIDVAKAVRQNRPYASEEWVKARLAISGLSGRKPGRPRKMNN